MGKRSDFKRIDRDFYRTFDPRAVAPLLPHLAASTRFVEPCAGAGDLIAQLEGAGHACALACDIEPLRRGIRRRDALTLRKVPPGARIITNPPWQRPLLHALTLHLSALAPTWLLFDADWMHTRQSAPYMPYCRKIISVGRVRWIPDTTDDGKGNAAWYLFDRTDMPAAGPVFHGRVAA